MAVEGHAVFDATKKEINRVLNKAPASLAGNLAASSYLHQVGDEIWWYGEAT